MMIPGEKVFCFAGFGCSSYNVANDTLPYFSPDMWDFQKKEFTQEYGVEFDWFSFGVLLSVYATGQYPQGGTGSTPGWDIEYGRPITVYYQKFVENVKAGKAWVAGDESPFKTGVDRLLNWDEYKKLKKDRSKMSVPFERVEEHPVLNSDFWFSNAALLNMLNKNKPPSKWRSLPLMAQEGTKKTKRRGMNFGKKKKKKVEKDLLQDFWGYVCWNFALEPCLCPAGYRPEGCEQKFNCNCGGNTDTVQGQKSRVGEKRSSNQGNKQCGKSLCRSERIASDSECQELECATVCAGSEAEDAKGSKNCFPGNSKVETPRGVISVSELRVGDRVQAVDHRGRTFWDDVYFFGHADEHSIEQYLLIELDGPSSPKLQVSHKHFLPGCLSGQRCSWADRIETYAQNFKKGDYVWISSNSGMHMEVEQRPIQSVSSVRAKGLYNPYTLSGNLVVDGVVSSAHSNWILDDLTPASCIGLLPSVYQVLFFPGQILYHILSLVGPGTRESVVNILDVNSPQSAPENYGHGPKFLMGSLLSAFLLTYLVCERFAHLLGKPK
eukprot:gnl/MRDRNA2_/MRDRNA2_65660_c0_seq1.p1 gnl/MRDRNA2_/MRDRNA2_65660_c0~~gnl/MRDRNA2_/MRDRNA2_65660_c0_seq1.p1  ORF type:complete len:551 (+),score=86.21 gnl/MRDRNA2_/MRDRNA2_65660_c0_seq1:29-1681(+)